jgi:hypothetical protein
VVERTSVFVILVSEFFDEVDLVADGCGGVVCVDVVLNNVVTECSSYVCYGGGNGGSEVSEVSVDSIDFKHEIGVES